MSGTPLLLDAGDPSSTNEEETVMTKVSKATAEKHGGALAGLPLAPVVEPDTDSAEPA